MPEASCCPYKKRGVHGALFALAFTAHLVLCGSCVGARAGVYFPSSVVRGCEISYAPIRQAFSIKDVEIARRIVQVNVHFHLTASLVQMLSITLNKIGVIGAFIEKKKERSKNENIRDEGAPSH